MILCCGEALIDMIPSPTLEGGRDGFVPHSGGAVFNTAIALGRLGVQTGMITGLSTDMFGQQLADALHASHVDTTRIIRSDRPTTLAFVKLTDGHASYSFFDENSAGRMIRPEDLPDLSDEVSALFFGGIRLAVDPCADPEVMRPKFLYAKQKNLKLLCANPDIVVDRGETREWCAGALAQLYTEMGGESLYVGKPHAPIYELARMRLAQAGVDCPPERILAVGDGLKTDILGAQGEPIDSLFISGGLSREDTGTTDQPDPEKLDRALVAAQVEATWSIGFLR